MNIIKSYRNFILENNVIPHSASHYIDIISTDEYQTKFDNTIHELIGHFDKIDALHGSRDGGFDKFNDDSFYTTNDYIASSYSWGGKLYEVEISDIKPLILYDNLIINKTELDYSKENRMLRKNIAGSDWFYIKLYYDVYGIDVVERYIKGSFRSVSYIVDGDYKPLIEYISKYGADSLMMNDESYDKQISDTTFFIPDSNKINIKNIYDIDNNGEIQWDR